MDEIRNTILQVETLKNDKRFSDAIELLHKTIVKYSDDYRLYEELADIYLYQGDHKKAMSALDFSLTLNPKSATGNYLKGFILLAEDKLTEAIYYLETSNRIFWNNAEVLRNLGWAYTMSNQHERGITILKRALNISPEDELITEDLAMALIGTGDIVAGNKLLKKIGKSSSTHI
jgi:tetratricopeptide (TPR) repeat protein